MNAMGHDVPTLIGVSQKGIAREFSKLVPDYMSMGETGMAEMSEMSETMEMPLPENTLPMMTGKGQFGNIDMGGMFTVLKVRHNVAKNNNADPGHYQHPKGTVAYELLDNATLPTAAKQKNAPETKPAIEFDVRKPQMGGAGHKNMEH